MSVGVLVVTHGAVGGALIDTAARIFAAAPANLACYGMAADHDPDAAYAELCALRDGLDCSDGLLILTDLCGATPHNVAMRLLDSPPPAVLVAGLNLPMAVKLFSAERRDPAQLADSITLNGRMGILIEAGD